MYQKVLKSNKGLGRGLEAPCKELKIKTRIKTKIKKRI